MDEQARTEFIEAALAERDRWQSVLRSEPDGYGSIEDLVTLHKEAILNPEQTLAEAFGKMWTAPDRDED